MAPLQLPLFAVLMHVPDPLGVLQVFLTQHWTSSGSLGQKDLRLKPERTQLPVFSHVPFPCWGLVLVTGGSKLVDTGRYRCSAASAN